MLAISMKLQLTKPEIVAATCSCSNVNPFIAFATCYKMFYKTFKFAVGGHCCLAFKLIAEIMQITELKLCFP